MAPLSGPGNDDASDPQVVLYTWLVSPVTLMYREHLNLRMINGDLCSLILGTNSSKLRIAMQTHKMGPLGISQPHHGNDDLL